MRQRYRCRRTRHTRARQTPPNPRERGRESDQTGHSEDCHEPRSAATEPDPERETSRDLRDRGCHERKRVLGQLSQSGNGTRPDHCQSVERTPRSGGNSPGSSRFKTLPQHRTTEERKHHGKHATEPDLRNASQHASAEERAAGSRPPLPTRWTATSQPFPGVDSADRRACAHRPRTGRSPSPFHEVRLRQVEPEKRRGADATLIPHQSTEQA